MEILFATSDMEAAAMTESALAEVFGSSGRKVGQRLYELAAMECLAVAAALPMLKLTQHSGAPRYSVSVSATNRIFFEPILGLSAQKPHAEIDLMSVTAIRIISWGRNS